MKRRALFLLASLPPAITVAAEGDARRWTPAALASDQYESSPTFTPDGREVFFVRADTRFLGWRILWSRCEAGGWTSPQAAPFAAPPPVVEADPMVTADGRRVYFVSSRQSGGASDDLDIWSVDRTPSGSWQQPRRLPEPVNSPRSELLPRPAAGGELYFGSDRPGGLGGADIYVATPASEGTWRVRNLGRPINSAADEYEAEVSADGRLLIIVADRGDRSHLYRYDRVGDEWIERGRVDAAPQVFQVGPLISPDGRRLLFAQADGERSGEIFVIDLAAGAVPDWPPRCGAD